MNTLKLVQTKSDRYRIIEEVENPENRRKVILFHQSFKRLKEAERAYEQMLDDMLVKKVIREEHY